MHGGGTAGTAAAQHAGRLGWALALTATYMVAEVVGGLVTGSLALLADAAHMLTDVGGLALALLLNNGDCLGAHDGTLLGELLLLQQLDNPFRSLFVWSNILQYNHLLSFPFLFKCFIYLSKSPHHHHHHLFTSTTLECRKILLLHRAIRFQQSFLELREFQYVESLKCA